MIDAYADPALWFIAREAAAAERRAGLLSRADGRSVDGFGFSTGLEKAPCETDPAGLRAANREARKRRLQVARWWAQARREWEAEVAECRRRACDEFAVVLSAGDWAETPRDLGRPNRLACLLVTDVNLRPVSERGEAKNGVEVAFEIESKDEPSSRAAERQAPRRFAETFGWPSRAHHDGGALASRRLARLGLATGVIGPEALGRVVQVGWRGMMGARLVAGVRRETLAGSDAEIISARIDGLKIWAAGTSRRG